MDFLRRLLGLPRDFSATTREDDVVITHDDGTMSSPPAEPVIETPDQTEQSEAGNAEVARTVEAPDDGPVIEVMRDSAAIYGTRPLPPLETLVPQPGQRMTFGQRSDVGMVRGNNQDAMLSLLSAGTSNDDVPDFGLFVVADGMGGHQEGERASAITTRMVAKHVLDKVFFALLNQSMNEPDRPSVADVLRTAFQEANEAVTDQIPEGGTTATTGVILGDLAYIAHVGDSRAYMITDEGIEQVTRDHSLVQRLIELDQLTPEEAAEHPQRNVLYRAIGQSETLDVDAITRRLPPRSRLLLCSDGLWNMVSEEAMLEMILQHNNPQEACNKLVKMANDRGGPDNITIILVQMPG